MIFLGKLFVNYSRLKKRNILFNITNQLGERKILLNMINRIGDAVIVAPMIKRMEKDGLSVSVICSSLNRFVFEKAGIHIEAECKGNEPPHILKPLLLLKTIFEIKIAKRSQDFDVLLTSQYSPQIKNYAKKCKKIIGFAFGPSTFAFDYSIPYDDKKTHKNMCPICLV